MRCPQRIRDDRTGFVAPPAAVRVRGPAGFSYLSADFRGEAGSSPRVVILAKSLTKMLTIVSEKLTMTPVAN